MTSTDDVVLLVQAMSTDDGLAFEPVTPFTFFDGFESGDTSKWTLAVGSVP